MQSLERTSGSSLPPETWPRGFGRRSDRTGRKQAVPGFTERTNAARLKLSRLRAIATGCRNNAGRLTLPGINNPQSLEALLSAWPAGPRPCLARRDRFARQSRMLWRHARKDRPTQFSFRPEGGFSPEELELIGKKTYATPTSMGKRLLRAERAALHCLSQHVAGLSPEIGRMSALRALM